MSTMNGDTIEAASGGDTAAKKKEKLTVEKIYQKKSQLEHILLRPDTYIGSVEFVTESMWVFDQETKHMVQKDLSYVPGLYKIFDEILVNAADNKQRDPSMDTIKINIDKENNSISIWNNGHGIPVVMHKEEKMYVPTMIFGHLLTSSNYNDEEEKVTGGRNGYGAKLCNIFSNKFTVETATKEYKRGFKQTWTNNMGNASEPKIKDFGGHDYTQITFSPDLSKFKMTSLDDDIVQLMTRRAYDIAASSRGVKVFLNGERLPVKNFKDYVDLYIRDKTDDVGNPLKCVYDNMGERWEVAVAISDKGFQQVSFVNSIATSKGGRHVDHVTDMLVKKLIETINKKNQKGMSVKPFQVKSHMWIFINCLIVNPTFDSQTKEHMTLQAKSFGSKCSLNDKFINQVVKCGIVEAVVQWAQFKAQNQLQKACSNKKQTKLKGVPKLDDANLAGTGKSNECTLILTEGDSAKALAMAGLGVIGRDRYGVFPLRGKLLNVREASYKQILENAEINNLIKIIGLQYKKKYLATDDLKTLRYGKVMIMTDQDQDGSHIKGLLINFFHYNWPELLQRDFLEEFITPIVKATKGNQVFSFYSLPEYDEWREKTPNWYTFKIKYYKGLGTSTSKEAKEYFSDMDRHRIVFRYNGQQDDQLITMAFAKKLVEQRKDWLTNWMEEVKKRKELGLGEDYLYEKNTKEITYTDFINKELVLFSNYDNERSIPNMMDGLKPGQRKVLFTCLKRNDKREVKVAQLAGSVAEHSAYHHGEASLMSTIINLAQNFVGTNNINLLQPIGQFGSRVNGGKDAASPRYIFTMLSPLVKCIFHPDDNPLLTWNYDDNQKVEPVWYCPIIPMILVNGSDGIGTGWMTKILNYNPRELISNLELMIKGDDPKPMMPWYKNFKGEIRAIGDSRYAFYGEISILSNSKIEISELPIGVWTQTYKENVLEPMLHGGEKIQSTISEYKEYSTDSTVRFVVTMAQDELIKAENEGLHKYFKLVSVLSIGSMCIFDNFGCMRKFESTETILKEYFVIRKELYVKRKNYNEGLLDAEANKLTNQARFIVEKCDGILKIENKKKKIMIEDLIQRKYDPDPVRKWKMERNAIEAEAELQAQGIKEDPKTEKEVDEEDENTKGYDYLLGMTLWSLTKERKDALLKQRDEKNEELVILKKKTPSDLWVEDLEVLKKELDKWEIKEAKQDQQVPVKGKGSKPMKSLARDNVLSANARKVEVVIDSELLKKVAKISEAKERKKRKPKSLVGSENDEADPALKPLSERLNNSPEKIANEARKKLKQSKLAFKKKEEEVLPKREKLARSSASKALEKWSSTKDSNESSSFEGHFSETSEDSDDIFAPKKKAKKTKSTAPQALNISSEDMFDNLVNKDNKTSDTVEEAPKPEAPKPEAPKPKAKTAAEPKKRGRQPQGGKAKKAKKMDSSDSEDFGEITKKRGKGKSQASDEEEIEVVPRKLGRARKPITYDLASSESDF